MAWKVNADCLSVCPPVRLYVLSVFSIFSILRLIVRMSVWFCSSTAVISCKCSFFPLSPIAFYFCYSLLPEANIMQYKTVKCSEWTWWENKAKKCLTDETETFWEQFKEEIGLVNLKNKIFCYYIICKLNLIINITLNIYEKIIKKSCVNCWEI